MVLKEIKFVHFWIFTVKFKSNRLSLHVTSIQCNGLESNEKFLSKKKFFEKKKQIRTKKNFGSLEIFQSLCEKQ